MGRRDARRARARRNARDGKGQKKTPARSAREEEETEASSDRWSPSGSPRSGVARTFVCLGNRANPPSSNCSPPPSAAVIVSRSPRRRGADRRRYHVGRSNAPARGRRIKERCLLQADACSRGAPTECLSRAASPIFLATPGARRSAALGRRRSARRVNVNGRIISPLPKSTPRWRLLRSISRFPGISSASRVKSVVRRLF
jgi:hypothetical protein